MARRGLTGQLNMFDFVQNLDDGEIGEVEMVSLMPSFDEEITDKKPRKARKKPEVIEEPKVIEEPEVVEEPEIFKEPEVVIEKKVLSQDAVMSRTYEINGETIKVSYLNYNKVSVKKGNNEPEMHYFENSKDAVDFYVQYMQEMEHEG